MKILVTGSNGFIGKNLIAELKNRKAGEILEYDLGSTAEDLRKYSSECDFVFHLAGINRPEKEEQYREGNYGFTAMLLENLDMHGNRSPVLMASSIQATLNNPYGKSKLEAEKELENYGTQNDIPFYIYRLHNVFGKWCRPSYNSVVATFCHNIASDLPIKVNDPLTILRMVYIDDVVSAFISHLTVENVNSWSGKIFTVDPVHTISLGDLAMVLTGFKMQQGRRELPFLGDPLIGKLYATYLSYLPADQFGYELKMNTDERGSFTEFLRTPDRGQVSVNISKPGIVKGNHWHHTKNEKFLVVCGTGIIRFRKIGTSEVIEYKVNGDKLTVVDIPPGYTHNIENLGSNDMVTIMWASEAFDPEHPDTIPEQV